MLHRTQMPVHYCATSPANGKGLPGGSAGRCTAGLAQIKLRQSEGKVQLISRARPAARRQSGWNSGIIQKMRPQRNERQPKAGTDPGAGCAPEPDFSSVYVQPIVYALHSQRFDLARLLLSDALRALRQAGLTDGERERHSWHLRLLNCHIRWASDERSWNTASYRAARRRFERRAQTAAGEAERLRHLICIRINAELDGLEPFPRVELDVLLDQAAGQRLDPGLWHNLAGWAFRHAQRDLLARAYEELLTNPDTILGSARWQRVNLMFLLSEGRATSRDVEETINTLQVVPQLREFRGLLWPACEAAGLTNAELKSLFERRATALETEHPPSTAQPRTQSLRSASAALAATDPGRR